MKFTLLRGGFITLRLSEVEYFYDEKGITVIVASDGTFHKVRETAEMVGEIFFREKQKKAEMFT